MERVDVKTGFNCNNRCRFCVQGDKRDLYGNKDTDEVKKVLETARLDSDSIVFTGGEVTIRKDVVELVRYAKDLGFTRIQVQTNGRMLAYRKFTEQLIEAGANEFSPALHGHTAEIHDYLTGAKGAFRQTALGIRLLRELGQTIITNAVITRANYRFLPELARVLVKLGVDQFQLAFVHPLGTAMTSFYEIVPRMALIEPYVKEALDVGLRARRSVMTEAIPYCFMEGYHEYIGERVVPRTKIFDAKTVLEDYTEYRLTEGKAKRDACRECIYDEACEGPWREYPEHYGWDEFVPVRQRASGVAGSVSAG
jgi:MoaA/NifB/PqqE/SkfB family radical SAM enzyme